MALIEEIGGEDSAPDSKTAQYSVELHQSATSVRYKIYGVRVEGGAKIAVAEALEAVAAELRSGGP